MPNPEAAYELCNDFLPDCDRPLPRKAAARDSGFPPDEGDDGPHQDDDSRAGYMGMSEDELLNREGYSPQQYLEFTEAEAWTPPPVQQGPPAPPATEQPPPAPTEEEDNFNYMSVAGEPGLRGPTGVNKKEDYSLVKLFQTEAFSNRNKVRWECPAQRESQVETDWRGWTE